MSKLIDGQVENASHDFDKIKQVGCEHGKEKKLNIDVDKILGLKGDDLVSVDAGDYGDYYGDYEPDAEVLSTQQVNIKLKLHHLSVLSILETVFSFFYFQMRDAVASVASEFEFNQKTVDEIKQEAENEIKGTK